MYLKSIEIHGFKSFANRILFKFNDGITAIVGPNGSGKSNVADAVRWVLGEQSAKQLRGSKMEDIIFSGTQLRKAMGFAYVAITFDNSDRALNIDYEEVTVARRVYRSGESEYLINGNTCRLRDVQELFFDTGIGKEGYSIIGQGQIDKILSGKPEDRRELFDEAAGIVKYKKRKAAAEKELEEEGLNLARITDILSEIEKQVGPLEKQSEVAKEYLKLNEELKKYEINLFLADYDKNTEAKEEALQKQDIIKNDIENTQKDYDNTKLEYERLEGEMSVFTSKIDESREKKNSLLISSEKREGEIRLMEEKKNSLYQSNAHYEQRKNTINEEIDQRLEEIEKQGESRKDTLKQIEELKSNQSDSGDELNNIQERIKACSAEIEKYNGDLMNLIKEDSKIKTEKQKFETLNEQNALKKAELTKKVLNQKNFENEYETAVETFNRELTEIGEKLEELETAISAQKNEKQKLRERLDETTGFLEKFQKEKIELESRVGTLRDFSERYEGYGNSIKKVMEQKPKYPGLIGVVSDIIEVDEKYETAVETALGGNIQNIVTRDEATAKRMIEFLKENKLGRATFLPLNAITAKEANQDPALLKAAGVIGYANKLVKTSKEYAEVVKYLLGRIIVVDDIDNALKLAKANNYSLRIVTLEGEQLNPGGSLSGGSYKNNSNLLGRKREMEEAEKQVQKILVKVNALSRERDGFKEMADKISEEIAKKHEEIGKLNIRQNTIQMNLEKEKERLKESKESFSVTELEIHDLERKTAENNMAAEKLSKDLEANEARRIEINDAIEGLNHKLDEERRLERYSNERESSLRVEFAGLEHTLGFIDETVARLNSEIEKFKEEITELDSNEKSSEDQLASLDEEIKQAHSDIASWKLDVEEMDKEIEGLEKEKAVITKGHKDFFNRHEELAKTLTSLEKDAFRIENQITRIGEVIDEQCAYMWNEYEVTVDSAKEKRDDTLGGYNAVKKGVSEIKSKIKGLGDVNVNAIEQYKEVSERYNLYTVQRNDIIEAEDKLKGIIETLEEEMRNLFNEKFALIRDEFDVVFKELFGGGQGTLELMEDEDVLTAGIKINAQPPGKKLQNMMMLSGGERALTAIALLFAIQNLKPSPFCLLDEIEAALDDSNVGRYARYLHKLTNHTQFIVITHRRGTMASADALYGITMQEKGVSALVSVSLIENSLSN
ncbi:MAG: chromosome segregation protein SMC [Lachnospiraceae bacterium]|nr:chromosome segregation protein SMC [Lachnospiraceae bacterium]